MLIPPALSTSHADGDDFRAPSKTVGLKLLRSATYHGGGGHASDGAAWQFCLIYSRRIWRRESVTHIQATCEVVDGS